MKINQKIFLFFLSLIPANLCVSQFNNFIIVSIPKTGTHLAEKALHLILKRSGYSTNLPLKKDWPSEKIKSQVDTKNINQFLSGHALYDKDSANTLAKNNWKGLFCIRDPRDAVVSLAFWIGKGQYFKGYHKLSLQDRIKIVLEGPKEGYLFHKRAFPPKAIKAYPELFKKQIDWIKEKNFLEIKFEDLVGPKGNGSQESQLKKISEIAKHINVNLPDYEAVKISNNLFGNTNTFRKGQIGTWKKYFTEEHKLLAKKHFGKILIDLGYENNTNW